MNRASAWALLFVLVGCTAGGGNRGDAGVGSRLAAGNPLEGCDPGADADGDGVADQAEGTFDADGDGTPNHQDTDSDNDGILDAEEHQGNIPCSLPDADGDGVPNWLDGDSDNDGLPDVDERGTYSTDPYGIDTDGDGVTDLGEALGTMTDPNDPSSTIAPEDFFVVLPYMGDPVEQALRFDTNLQLADVYFLIDTTGSMGGPIDNVTSSLTRIASEIGTRIPNVQLGVGQYRDFPMGGGSSGGPFPIPTGGYGSPGDMPYENIQNITADVSAVQAGLGTLSAAGGADGPESSVEALYQTATGEGGSWSDGTNSFDLPRQRCTAVPDEVGRRRGYPCFRPDSLPIVVLVTDAPFHNGPGMPTPDPYMGITPPPHFFDQAVTALTNIGARMIGVAVGSGPQAHQEEVARMTGTVDTDGSPLVYLASGGTVSDAIIEGIETLAGRTPQDVDTTTENVDGNPDGFDATQFIDRIVPLEGYNGGVSGPNPGVTYDSKDETTFYQVVPGTQVEFTVHFYNDVRPPAETAQIFRARIIVRGNGVARLDDRNVYIIVPPDGVIILI